jgi:hypothetical protein
MTENTDDNKSARKHFEWWGFNWWGFVRLPKEGSLACGFKLGQGQELLLITGWFQETIRKLVYKVIASYTIELK